MKRFLLFFALCLVAPAQARLNFHPVAGFVCGAVGTAAVLFAIDKASDFFKPTEKFKALSDLAESGDAVAQYRLAYSYECGNVWDS